MMLGHPSVSGTYLDLVFQYMLLDDVENINRKQLGYLRYLRYLTCCG